MRWMPNMLDKNNWHRWFAWHPVQVQSGETVWLESVERRVEDWGGYNGPIVYSYRLAERRAA